MRAILRGAILGMILSIIFSSCASYKRCNRRFPPEIHDSIMVKDSIIIRDRMVFDTIPGDTSYILVDTSWFEEGQPIILQNDYSMARLKKENNRFRLELIQKDTTISRLLKGAEIEKSHVQEIKETKVIKERFIPRFYRFSFWYTLGTWGLIILYILFSLFGTRLKR